MGPCFPVTEDNDGFESRTSRHDGDASAGLVADESPGDEPNSVRSRARSDPAKDARGWEALDTTEVAAPPLQWGTTRAAAVNERG